LTARYLQPRRKNEKSKLRAGSLTKSASRTDRVALEIVATATYGD
jgi:hypothetical protein